MITQRTRSGGTANAAAMAGNAMFMVESSEIDERAGRRGPPDHGAYDGTACPIR